MKQVFTHSSVVPCDLVVSVLEAAGIQAVIRNPLGSAAAGYSLPVRDNPSLPWAWPEVWVADEDYASAIELLRAADAGGDGRGGVPAESNEPAGGASGASGGGLGI